MDCTGTGICSLSTVVYSGRRSTLQLRPWLMTDSSIWHRWCLQWRA